MDFFELENESAIFYFSKLLGYPTADTQQPGMEKETLTSILTLGVG